MNCTNGTTKENFSSNKGIPMHLMLGTSAFRPY